MGSFSGHYLHTSTVCSGPQVLMIKHRLIPGSLVGYKLSTDYRHNQVPGNTTTLHSANGCLWNFDYVSHEFVDSMICRNTLGIYACCSW